MHLGIFFKICPVETSCRHIWVFIVLLPVSTLCKLRLVRTSHGFLNLEAKVASWDDFIAPNPIDILGLKLVWSWSKSSQILGSLKFIGRICLKNCKQTIIFWCLELMVLLNILEEITANAHSSIANGSSAQLSREKTNSDLVSVASLCFF